MATSRSCSPELFLTLDPPSQGLLSIGDTVSGLVHFHPQSETVLEVVTVNFKCRLRTGVTVWKTPTYEEDSSGYLTCTNAFDPLSKFYEKECFLYHLCANAFESSPTKFYPGTKRTWPFKFTIPDKVKPHPSQLTGLPYDPSFNTPELGGPLPPSLKKGTGYSHYEIEHYIEIDTQNMRRESLSALKPHVAIRFSPYRWIPGDPKFGEMCIERNIEPVKREARNLRGRHEEITDPVYIPEVSLRIKTYVPHIICVGKKIPLRIEVAHNDHESTAPATSMLLLTKLSVSLIALTELRSGHAHKGHQNRETLQDRIDLSKLDRIGSLEIPVAVPPNKPHAVHLDPHCSGLDKLAEKIPPSFQSILIARSYKLVVSCCVRIGTSNDLKYTLCDRPIHILPGPARMPLSGSLAPSQHLLSPSYPIAGVTSNGQRSLPQHGVQRLVGRSPEEARDSRAHNRQAQQPLLPSLPPHGAKRRNRQASNKLRIDRPVGELEKEKGTTQIEAEKGGEPSDGA